MSTCFSEILLMVWYAIYALDNVTTAKGWRRGIHIFCFVVAILWLLFTVVGLITGVETIIRH